MAPPDRDAILARRALFLASTLAGLGSAKGAKADEPVEPETCPTPTDTSPGTIATARELVNEGVELLKHGKAEEAVLRLGKAYEIYPVPAALLLLGQAERMAGDPASALKHLRTFVRCAPEHPRIVQAQELVTELEKELASLIIEGGAAGVEIQIDGVVAGKLPLSQPIVLTPGQHTVTVQRSDCETYQAQVLLAQGETRTVKLDAACVPPMPCLQACLEPCLSIGRTPNDEVARFGAGVAPLLLYEPVPEDQRRFSFGGRVEVFYLVPIGEPSLLRIGLTAMPSSIHGGSLVPIGGDMEFAFLAGPLRVGAGVSGGYAFSSADRSDSAAFSPVSSGFVYPYMVPIAARIGDHCELGLHVGVLLSKQASANESRFAPTWFSSGLFFRILFGSARKDHDYDLARLPLLAPLD